MKKIATIALLLALSLTPDSRLLAMSSEGTGGPMLPGFKAGMMASKGNQFEEAEKHLLETVKEHPNHPDSWSLLGFVSRKLGKIDASFAAYKESLAIDEDFRPALNYLGHLYLETGQMDKAKETLGKLSDACFFGCPEYDDLKKAVEAGKSGKY